MPSRYILRDAPLVSTPYAIRKATPADAHRIAPLLREKDRREVEASTGKCPEEVLPQAFNLPGEVLFAETAKSKQPILIGGVSPTPDRGADSAAIWMLGTPLLERFGFVVGRRALLYVEKWSETYRRLWNTAWADNDLHVGWIDFLGFSITGRFQHRGHNFIQFERTNTCA